MSKKEMRRGLAGEWLTVYDDEALPGGGANRWSSKGS